MQASIWSLSQARIKWEGCGRKGIRRKNGGAWRWALISPDGVAPSRMVGVSASVYLLLHHEVQKISSGTGYLGSPRKRAIKWLCASDTELYVQSAKQQNICKNLTFL